MKVKIKKSPDWFGCHQLANVLLFWAPKIENPHGDIERKWAFDLGEWFQTPKRGQDTWLHRFFEKRHEKKEANRVKVEIEDHDVWSADETLAMIIVPTLQKLKEVKHGRPLMDEEDVPAYLIHLPDDSGEEWDRKATERWDWAMDEMIWAFSQSLPSNSNWRSLYDLSDHIGMKLHQQRILRGRKLFAKYFDNLWD